MSPARQARRVRQSDIAKLAGVSQTTVSLVLSGNPAGVGLPEKTRRRVLETADRLGYVPDPAARRLAAGRSFLVGLHTFTATFPVDLRSSYYPFLVGIEEEAAAKGYDLLFTGLSGSEASAGRESALSRLQLADGGILIGRHPSVSEVGRLLDDGFPLVYVGRRDEFGDRLPYVGADYARAAAYLIRRLHMLGHRRIMYVREPDEAVAASDRERGIRAGLAAAGLLSGPDCVARADGSDLTGDRLLGWLRTGITAIIVEGTDTLAAAKALRSTAEAAGLRYPEDFSLAMTGEQVYPDPNAPVITGFAVPRRAMGREAARLLVSMLGGDEVDDAKRQQLLPCSFIEGDTSGPPPASGASRRTITTAAESTTQEARAGAVASTRAHDERAPAPATREIDADVLVVGGGLGGVAATIAACRSAGGSCSPRRPTGSAGSSPRRRSRPTSIPGSSSSAAPPVPRAPRPDPRLLPHLVPADGRGRPSWRDLNPGAGWVSKLCHEPRVALAVLDGDARPAPAPPAGSPCCSSTGRAAPSVDRDHVRAVELEFAAVGERVTVTAPYVLDATEHGDLLPLAGRVRHRRRVPRRARRAARARRSRDPLNLQGFTCCFALEHRAGEDHTIDRPSGTTSGASYQARLLAGAAAGAGCARPADARAGRPRPRPQPRRRPARGARRPGQHQGAEELWTFRRILAREAAPPGVVRLRHHAGQLADERLLARPARSRWTRRPRSRHLGDAKQLSLSLLYWLQTEAPRPDGGTGFPGLRLRPDVVGTEDGLAKTPYVRESRRIRAVTTVTEQRRRAGDRRPERRDAATTTPSASAATASTCTPPPAATTTSTSPACPFQIPLGALLPVRVHNLLPAGKNLGTTHITNGCYRLHPVEWNIGEAAGPAGGVLPGPRCRAAPGPGPRAAARGVPTGP